MLDVHVVELEIGVEVVDHGIVVPLGELSDQELVETLPVLLGDRYLAHPPLGLAHGLGTREHLQVVLEDGLFLLHLGLQDQVEVLLPGVTGRLGLEHVATVLAEGELVQLQTLVLDLGRLKIFLRDGHLNVLFELAPLVDGLDALLTQVVPTLDAVQQQVTLFAVVTHFLHA